MSEHVSEQVVLVLAAGGCEQVLWCWLLVGPSGWCWCWLLMGLSRCCGAGCWWADRWLWCWLLVGPQAEVPQAGVAAWPVGVQVELVMVLVLAAGGAVPSMSRAGGGWCWLLWARWPEQSQAGVAVGRSGWCWSCRWWGRHVPRACRLVGAGAGCWWVQAVAAGRMAVGRSRWRRLEQALAGWRAGAVVLAAGGCAGAGWPQAGAGVVLALAAGGLRRLGGRRSERP